MNRRPPDVLVLIDSREGDPLRFPASRVATLRVGDYAPAGLEGELAIERKSHADLAGCCGQGRDRFRAQLERLAALPRGGHLVLEPSVDAILMGPMLVTSRISPKVILQTLLSWSVELRVPVWFAGDRLNAAAIVLGICRHAIRHFGDLAAVQREALVALSDGAGAAGSMAERHETSRHCRQEGHRCT